MCMILPATKFQRPGKGLRCLSEPVFIMKRDDDTASVMFKMIKS